MTTTDQRSTGAVTAAAHDDEQARALVVEALHAGAPTIVVQPILGLATGRTVAFEALARFTHGEPSLPPDRWFALAHRAGLGAMLEARAVELALRLGHLRPDNTLLSVNVSPSVVGSTELAHVLPDDLTGVQLELTGVGRLDDPGRLAAPLAALRRRGARIAVDDVGEGYVALQRVMLLAPDVLKLDRSLAAGIQYEAGKAAIVEAIVGYAATAGAVVCAEGVESLEDLYLLADLDVAEAQGWVVGMPAAGFEPVTDPSRLTCEASFSRALAVGGRTARPGATPSLEHVIGRLVDVTHLDHLGGLMAMVADVVGCDRAELSVVDETGGWLEALGPGACLPSGPRYRIGDSALSRRVLDTQEMAQVLVGSPDADPQEAARMAERGLRSMVLTPVVSAGRPVGLLECSQREDLSWSRAQLRKARTLGAVLGPVLDTLRRGSPG